MRLNELLEDIRQPFQSYNQVENEEWRDEGDCVIIALAITCGVSYEVARQTVMKRSNMDNNGYRGFSREALKRSVNDLGFEYKVVDTNYYLEKIDNMLPNGANAMFLTTRHLMRCIEVFDDEKHEHNQLWCMDGHVFACKNGKIEGLVYDDRVTEIIDVFKPGQQPSKKDTSSFSLEEKITNYNDCVNQYMKSYNEKIQERFAINHREAKEKFDNCVTMALKHNYMTVADPLVINATKSGRQQEIIIHIDNNWKGTVV